MYQGLNISTNSSLFLAVAVKHPKYRIPEDSPLRNEPQCNFSNRSCRRSYDTDSSSIRYTTTSFGIQTPQQS